MRQKDNFENAFLFLKHILTYYDLTNSNDFNELKMKIWTLDGPVWEEELNDDGTMDHYSLILNEIVFLDAYIKFKDNNDSTFNDMKIKRINNINTLNYMINNTTISDDQFLELYELYLIRYKNNKITSIFDIFNNVTVDNIDKIIKHNYDTFNSLNTIDVLSSTNVLNGISELMREDNLLVLEMNKLHDKLFSYIKMYSDENSILVNVPSKRYFISPISNHYTHVDLVNEYSNVGGYRYTYKDNKCNILDIDRSTYRTSLVNDKYGCIEDTWLNWQIASSEIVSGTVHIKPLDLDINSLDGESRVYFEELNSQWVVLNDIREGIFYNTGLRSKIESLFNNEVIDMKEYYKKLIENKIELKEKIINILNGM